MRLCAASTNLYSHAVRLHALPQNAAGVDINAQRARRVRCLGPLPQLKPVPPCLSGLRFLQLVTRVNASAIEQFPALLPDPSTASRWPRFSTSLPASMKLWVGMRNRSTVAEGRNSASLGWTQ